MCLFESWSYREGETERDLPSSGPLSKWPSGQGWARLKQGAERGHLPRLPHGQQQHKHLGSFCSSPRCIRWEIDQKQGSQDLKQRSYGMLAVQVVTYSTVPLHGSHSSVSNL